MYETVVLTILGNEWFVLLTVGIILLLATEFGFRVGIRHTAEERKNFRAQSLTLQGALLGLLGLLLGFTFAMSVGRYDTRRHLVLEEANDIGTCWLRAGLLSEASKKVIRPALEEYVAIRLKAAHSLQDPVEFGKLVERSEAIQAMLWRRAVQEVKEYDTPGTALFAESLNKVVDDDAKRRAALHNRVPHSVWFLLLLVSFAVCWTTGYTTALGTANRLVLSMVILPLLLSSVITIITDLDNPQEGLIKVSQSALVDLQVMLERHKGQ